MENTRETRTCADCKYYEECVKGRFGNVPEDACEFSDIIHHKVEDPKLEEKEQQHKNK